MLFPDRLVVSMVGQVKSTVLRFVVTSVENQLSNVTSNSLLFNPLVKIFTKCF